MHHPLARWARNGTGATPGAILSYFSTQWPCGVPCFEDAPACSSVHREGNTDSHCSCQALMAPVTSTCWQDVSLSNTVELTTVTPQKQKICRFKRRFLPVFENSRGSIVCLRAANLVMCHDWAVLFFTYVPVSVWQSADVRKNKTAQSWRVTGFAARRQTMEPLEFSKTGKKRRLKRQIFCFCGVTVVSSTVFERETSCQHVDVKMRRLRIFSVEKPGIIPRWGQSVSDRDFHTCLFFMYDTLLL